VSRVRQKVQRKGSKARRGRGGHGAGGVPPKRRVSDKRISFRVQVGDREVRYTLRVSAVDFLRFDLCARLRGRTPSSVLRRYVLDIGLVLRGRSAADDLRRFIVVYPMMESLMPEPLPPRHKRPHGRPRGMPPDVAALVADDRAKHGRPVLSARTIALQRQADLLRGMRDDAEVRLIEQSLALGLVDYQTRPKPKEDDDVPTVADLRRAVEHFPDPLTGED
jgi:hypothetical protein